MDQNGDRNAILMRGLLRHPVNSQERRDAFLGIIGLRTVNETVRQAMDQSNPGGVLDVIFEPSIL